MQDAWFPRHFALNEATVAERLLCAAADWQIYAANGGARLLAARPALAELWTSLGLLPTGVWTDCVFGEERFCWLFSPASSLLVPTEAAQAAEKAEDVLAFARALAVTRRCAPHAALEQGVFCELHGCLLPVTTEGAASGAGDELWLGEWLTGGVRVSAASAARVMQIRPGCTAEMIAAVREAAGQEAQQQRGAETLPKGAEDKPAVEMPRQAFALPGRTALESFLREHVIDIIEHEEDYAAMGIGFPSAFILQGPPGCGKTYAAEQLVEYLGWPAYYVEASTVGSPYIHETGKKIAALFDKAMEHAPSVLVLDEMESFLSQRDGGAQSGGHHVEEMAEFLRKIPEAREKHVLIIGMTNMIDAIDPAIRRRGRFDHVIEVGMPAAAEIQQVLEAGFAKLPHEDGLQTAAAAEALAGHPMSDVAFLLRETARLTAREHSRCISQRTLDAVVATLTEGAEERRSIGFHP